MADKNELFRDLQRLLIGMDCPVARFGDVRWLNRNLGINNQSHPDFPRAQDLIRRLLPDGR